MATHSPGPWQVFEPECSPRANPGIEGAGEDNRISIVVWDHEGEDGGIQGETYDEALANAHLIAAAPFLLAACQALLDLNPGDSPDLYHWEEAYELARKAVARATGRKEPA